MTKLIFVTNFSRDIIYGTADTSLHLAYLQERYQDKTLKFSLNGKEEVVEIDGLNLPLGIVQQLRMLFKSRYENGKLNNVSFHCLIQQLEALSPHEEITPERLEKLALKLQAVLTESEFKWLTELNTSETL